MPVERMGEEWLNPDDVEDGDTLTIIGKPELVETQWKLKDGTPKKRYRIEVKLPDGSFKPTTLNHTSSNALLEAFGPDENNWMDKAIIVEKRFQKVRGEDKHVLYFKAVKQIVQTEISEPERLTLTQAREMTKNWTPQLAADFIDHLRASGRLKEGE